MNLDELKKSGYIIFQCIAGSHSYGLNREDSDVDERGIYVLPLQQRLSIVGFDQEISNDTQDIKYYDICKYLKLAADCNPNIIELFWMPDDCIKFKDGRMDEIIQNRHLFISKKAYHTFSGYAYAQIQKCKGQNKLINNPKSQEHPQKEDFCWLIPNSYAFVHQNAHNNRELFDSFMKCPGRPVPIKDFKINLSEFHVSSLEHSSNIFRLYNYGSNAKGVFRGDSMLVCESIPIEDEREKFVGFLIYNQHEYEKALKEWKQYWDWVKNRNESRWTDQEKKLITYDAKNMQHCFRFLYSGKNIMKNSEPIVRFSGEQREFLMDIRNNKFSYEHLMQLVEREMAELDELKEKSSLPFGCNVKKVNELYLDLIHA